MANWRMTKEQMLDLITGLHYPSKKEAFYTNGYWHWMRHYNHYQLDDELSRLSEYKLEIQNNWLQRLRKARLLGVRGAGALFEISDSAYAQIEQSEKRGTITLKKLAEVANVYDCEVVYFLRPKKKARYSEYVWRYLYNMFRRDPYVQCAPENRQHIALVKLIKKKLGNAKFRKVMGWSLKE